MQTSDFDFELPQELIAQHPSATRGGSRLLVGLPEHREDALFAQLPQWVEAGDVMVFNNTRVVKARLFGEKTSGGKIEMLIERVLDEYTVLAHIRASKPPKPGSGLRFGEIEAQMQERRGDLFVVRFSGSLNAWEVMEQYGRLPLPPYITHTPDSEDETRYQTVYAKADGAVAAPTAGLHFTEALLQTLRDKGVIVTEITLHVGAGTFQPVRVDNIAEHVMHSEWYEISPAAAEAVNRAKAEGRRVWAVGTTSLRALESAAVSGSLKAGAGETAIFITPGYRFQMVDRLITNFHLPKSTLMMLVSAFAGMEEIRSLYAHAVAQRYRFFSYGDAMLLAHRD